MGRKSLSFLFSSLPSFFTSCAKDSCEYTQQSINPPDLSEALDVLLPPKSFSAVPVLQKLRKRLFRIAKLMCRVRHQTHTPWTRSTEGQVEKPPSRKSKDFTSTVFVKKYPFMRIKIPQLSLQQKHIFQYIVLDFALCGYVVSSLHRDVVKWKCSSLPGLFAA